MSAEQREPDGWAIDYTDEISGERTLVGNEWDGPASVWQYKKNAESQARHTFADMDAVLIPVYFGAPVTPSGERTDLSSDKRALAAIMTRIDEAETDFVHSPIAENRKKLVRELTRLEAFAYDAIHGGERTDTDRMDWLTANHAEVYELADNKGWRVTTPYTDPNEARSVFDAPTLRGAIDNAMGEQS